MVVSLTYIKFHKEFGTTDPVEEFADEGKGIAILGSEFVETMKIYTQPQETIWFLREEHGGATRGLGMMNETFSEVFFDICP